MMDAGRWAVDESLMKKIPGAQEAAAAKETGTNRTLDPMALGSVGWVMPGVKSYNDHFYGYRYWTDRGGLYLPDKRYGISVPHLQEVRYGFLTELRYLEVLIAVGRSSEFARLTDSVEVEYICIYLSYLSVTVMLGLR